MMSNTSNAVHYYEGDQLSLGAVVKFCVSDLRNTQPIHMIFRTGDYVGVITQQPKIQKRFLNALTESASTPSAII